MAKELPPYVSSTGLLQELLKKIQEAPPPARFSGDYLFSNLKFKKSGSTIPFIPFLKKLGFISSDGTPTDIYKKFRNPDKKTSGQAMAKAFAIAYADLYSRNEYWYKLQNADLKNFLVEVLEVEPKNSALGILIRTIETLKPYANFDAPIIDDSEEEDYETPEIKFEKLDTVEKPEKRRHSDIDGINLSYTINLNLPETSDIKVFDAIFKSLKENLLKK
jgi:hypothetical protein